MQPDRVYDQVCTGAGEYIFLAASPTLHFAEVEVWGFGGGRGHGHNSADDMYRGYRHDVGLHHDGAQYALTVPLANVSSSWWGKRFLALASLLYGSVYIRCIEHYALSAYAPSTNLYTPRPSRTESAAVAVPFVTGRQLVLELNTTWADETRHVRATVQHATYGGMQSGHEVWNMTETGEQRRASDGFVYHGPSGHVSFKVLEPTDDFVAQRVAYILQYRLHLPPANHSISTVFSVRGCRRIVYGRFAVRVRLSLSSSCHVDRTGRAGTSSCRRWNGAQTGLGTSAPAPSPKHPTLLLLPRPFLI